MSQAFDPYHKWLGIRPEEQPANHYRLLGLHIFEDDPMAVENAADQRMAHLRTLQAGKHAKQSQQLLNEVVAAKLCLLDEEAKTEYDAGIRRRIMGERQATQAAPAIGATVIPLTPIPEDPKFLTPVPEEASPLTPVPSEAFPSAVSPTAAAPPALRVGAIRTTPALSTGWKRIPTTRILGAAGIVAVGFVLVAIAAGFFLRSFDPEQDVEVARTKTQPPPPSQPALAELLRPTRAVPPDPVSANDETNDASTDRRVDTAEAAADDPTPHDGTDDPRPPTEADENVSPDLDRDSIDPNSGEAAVVPDHQAVRGEPGDPASVDERAVSGVVRSTVPGTQRQHEIAAKLEEIYPPASYVSSAKRLELARTFLKLGAGPGVAVDERFVLFRRTMELACDDGDATLMLSSINAIGKHFDVATRDVQTKMLRRFVGDGSDPQRVLVFLRTSKELVADAMAAGEFQAALQTSANACRLCERPVGSSEFRQSIRDDHTRIDRTQQEYEGFTRAQQRLDTTPDDPAANLAAGRWYCFVRGDWEHGLPHLAGGSDDRLKAVAMQELSLSRDDVDSVIEVGEAWWEVAQARSGDERLALARRARHCYESMAPTQLSGLAKLTVQKRQGEISELLANTTPALWQFGDERAAANADAERLEKDDRAGEFAALFAQAVNAAVKTHDYAVAERLLGQCVKLQPNHVPTLNNYALVSVQVRNYRRAMYLWEQAVELEPESPVLRHNLVRLGGMFDADNIKRDAAMRRELGDLISQTASSGSQTRGMGWLYLPIDNGRTFSRSQYEDDRCLRCDDTRAVTCPAQGCTRGSVRSMRTDVIGRNTISGQPILKNTPIRIPCGNCRGRGEVPCRDCYTPTPRYPYQP